MTYRLPLWDHRVLDLAEGVAACAGRLLGDMGAEVIKVEPTEGDPLRREDPDLFQQLNANKYGLCLVPGTEASLQALARLSDIVIVPADDQRADSLAQAHHGLITVRLPAQVSLMTGVAVAGAVGAALWARRRTGHGQVIDLAPQRPGELLPDPAARREPVSTSEGVIPVAPNPWLLSETPLHIRLPAPAIGEHNHYVLDHLLAASG
jgi:crotonobetainyl-CoA:carnitine CoA-transferase CaiB-like acyl-CoA transferase